MRELKKLLRTFRSALKSITPVSINYEKQLIGPEKPIEGINTGLIYDGVKASGKENVFFLETPDEIQAWLKENLKPNDILLTLGAGDVYRYGERYLVNGNS